MQCARSCIYPRHWLLTVEGWVFIWPIDTAILEALKEARLDVAFRTNLINRG